MMESKNPQQRRKKVVGTGEQFIVLSLYLFFCALIIFSHVHITDTTVGM